MGALPDALALFCAGSVIRGDHTPHSDIDLVVLLESIPNAWRESIVVEDWPVELFVHDIETLAYFVEQDCNRRQPSLPSMLADAIVIPRATALSDSLQRWARDILNHPPPVSSDTIDSSRYFISDLLDDLRDHRPRSELVAIAAKLHELLGAFILSHHGRWSADGKHLPRRLLELNPSIAEDFRVAFDAAFVGSDAQPLIAFAERVLEPAGGALFAGYRSDAPSSARTSSLTFE